MDSLGWFLRSWRHFGHPPSTEMEAAVIAMAIFGFVFLVVSFFNRGWTRRFQLVGGLAWLAVWPIGAAFWIWFEKRLGEPTEWDYRVAENGDFLLVAVLFSVGLLFQVIGGIAWLWSRSKAEMPKPTPKRDEKAKTTIKVGAQSSARKPIFLGNRI